MISCNKDEWSNGDPELDNIYYFGFKEWTAKFDNSYIYTTSAGSKVDVTVQFWSEFKRPYDVVTYFYVVSSNLTIGTDFQIVDEKGQIMDSDINGAYSIIWPNALKGVKNITVKSLNEKKGAIIIQTHDPDSVTPISSEDISSTVNNHTDKYEVRSFSQNYKVTVNIE